MNKKLARISASVLALCLGTLALTSCGKTTIDANSYVDIEFDGLDSQGTATPEIEFESLIEDNLKAFDLDDDSSDRAISKVEEKLQKYLSGELDKNSELSNGDTITFKWDKKGIEKLEEKYKVKFKFEDKKINVKDLELAEEFDPFDYLTVTFDGFAPNGKATLNYSDLPVSGIYFNCSKTEGLSNGDTVKVTFGESNAEDVCFSQGYKPTSTEKEYTVEGLASYVQKVDEIPKDAYDKLDANIQDNLKAHVASRWEEPEALKEIKLIGNYFLTPKDPDAYGLDNNYIYFVYKITEKQSKADKDHTYYYFGGYDNISILPDGTCSFDLSGVEITSNQFKYDGLYYIGYEDLDTLFSKAVTAYINKYQYESTVKE